MAMLKSMPAVRVLQYKWYDFQEDFTVDDKNIHSTPPKANQLVFASCVIQPLLVCLSRFYVLPFNLL